MKSHKIKQKIAVSLSKDSYFLGFSSTPQNENKETCDVRKNVLTQLITLRQTTHIFGHLMYNKYWRKTLKIYIYSLSVSAMKTIPLIEN